MEILTYVLLFLALFFEVFLLVSFLEKRWGRKALFSSVLMSEGDLPSVCIAVPCHNEARTMRETLFSLLSLSYPKEKLEIIVIDDGSTDGTAQIAQQYADQGVRVFSQEREGKHAAMNLALAHTDAELIGCLDADSVVEKDALRHIVGAFTNKAVAAVTPGIHVKKPETLLQHMQHVEYRLSIFNRFIFATLGSIFITPGPFSIFRTHVVRGLGGWRNGHSTEDMEIALRLQSAGHLIGNAPGAAVHTTVPRTIPTLFRQRVRWTYGFLRNAIDYRHMFANRSYGTLGLIILPSYIVSILAALYLFTFALWSGAVSLLETYTRIRLTEHMLLPSFDLFYINTSAMMLLAGIAIALVIALIVTGSLLGTGRRNLPAGTPLFIVFYGFLAPLWLGTALVRAILNTGVRWR